MPVQHILVPIDFSPNAEHAFDYTLRLARPLQARVTVLHVIEPLLMGHRDPLPYLSMHELEGRIIEQVSTYQARIIAAGLKGDFAVLHGVPYQVIVDTARTAQADLIVMGTHGRTGLAHVLVGSVAERVIQLAHCPVLVLRIPAESPARTDTEANG